MVLCLDCSTRRGAKCIRLNYPRHRDDLLIGLADSVNLKSNIKQQLPTTTTSLYLFLLLLRYLLSPQLYYQKLLQADLQ